MAKQSQNMKKKASSTAQENLKIYTMKDLQEKNFPKMISIAKETLGEVSDDYIISILRHFNWNTEKVNDQWFEKMDKLILEIGLEFDQSLNKKFPEIKSALKEQNSNCDIVWGDKFNPKDKDLKAVQLICGHQFSAMSWREYLKEKVKEQGAACVFTKCIQQKCNVVVPHSFFLDNLPQGLEDVTDEKGKTTKFNFKEKYQ